MQTQKDHKYLCLYSNTEDKISVVTNVNSTHSPIVSLVLSNAHKNRKSTHFKSISIIPRSQSLPLDSFFLSRLIIFLDNPL